MGSLVSIPKARAAKQARKEGKSDLRELEVWFGF
jgi:hypothetical protein